MCAPLSAVFSLTIVQKTNSHGSIKAGGETFTTSPQIPLDACAPPSPGTSLDAVLAKELCIHSKEPYIHSKEPYIHSKEPYIPSFSRYFIRCGIQLNVYIRWSDIFSIHEMVTYVFLH